MKNLTKIVLLALVSGVLVSIVACITHKAKAASPTSATTPISITSSSVRTPWASSCTPSYSTGNYYASCTISVPDNEEIVIQMISGQQLISDAPQLTTKVSTTSGGGGAVWYILPTAVNTPTGASDYLWSSPVTLYADPGSSIVVTVTNATTSLLSAPAGNGITFVGYTVTNPSS